MAVLPYARTGIIGAALLGLGRALGETMAVTMVIGNSPEIHASLFAPGYTLPAVIANEFAEATGAVHVGALAALGLVLFGITLRAERGRAPAGPRRRPRAQEERAREPARWRRLVNHLATALGGAAVLVAVIPLASVLWLVVSTRRGGPVLELLHQPSHAGGRARRRGGQRHRRDASTWWASPACSALPVGVGAGVYLAERGDSRLGQLVRFTAEVLSGVPSIVVGIVAYGLVVVPMKRFSALAGGVALALLMMPTLARTTEELVRLVPRRSGRPRWPWGSRSGGPACASCCGPRSAGSSPPSCSRWRAPPARPRRCSSPPSTTSTGTSTPGPAHRLAHRADLQLRHQPLRGLAPRRPGARRWCCSSWSGSLNLLARCARPLPPAQGLDDHLPAAQALRAATHATPGSARATSCAT